MRIAEAYVEIRGDYRKFRSELTKEGKTAGQQAAQAFAQAFGAVAFGAGIKKSIDAANRLQQAVGATEAVFGSAGKAVEDFAETSARSFGISASAARELTSQIGALLQGMGFTAEQAAATSVDIAKLGADLAATFGGKPEDAVLALGAALRGERDPIERYGISLNEAAVKQKALEMGLYDGVGALDANGKAQATLALIMERSAGAQGQFAREAGTAAGQQAIAAASAEDAAASFGEVLLPIYTRVVEVVGKLAQVFGGLPAPVQTAIVALAGMVAFAGPIRTVVDAAGKLRSAFDSAGRAATTAKVGVGILAGALIAYEVYQLSAAKSAERFNDALADLERQDLSGLEDALALWENAPWARPDDAEAWFKKIAEGSLAAAQNMLDGALASDELRLKLEDLGLTTDEMRAAVDAEAQAQANAADAHDRASEAVDGQRESSEELTDELSLMEQAINNANSALSIMLGTLDSEEAWLSVQDSMARFKEKALDAFSQGERSTDEFAQAQRDARQANIDLQQQVADYLLTLEDIPPKKATEILALIDQGKIAEAEFELAKLTAARTVQIYPVLVRQPSNVGGGNSWERDPNWQTPGNGWGPSSVDLPFGLPRGIADIAGAVVGGRLGQIAGRVPGPGGEDPRFGWEPEPAAPVAPATPPRGDSPSRPVFTDDGKAVEFLEQIKFRTAETRDEVEELGTTAKRAADRLDSMERHLARLANDLAKLPSDLARIARAS